MSAKVNVVIVSILVISAVILVVKLTERTKLESVKDVVLDVGTSTFITLREEESFGKISIIDWEYTSTEESKPIMKFTTQDSNDAGSTEIVYEQPYYYDIIEKGNYKVVRIFTPAVFYRDGDKVETSYLEVKVHTNLQTDFTTQNYNTQDSDDFEYLIITNESLWSRMNTAFKDWKIEQDPKITNISIVNVSDIISNSLFWVNGTYGDATNTTGGNHWIDNGAEVSSSYSLFNDTQAKIRNYIRWCYDTKATRYVLIVGNNAVVPTRMATSYATGDGGNTWDNDLSHACDMYYACLHKCMNNNTNSYWMENECYSYPYDDIDWGYELCVGRVPVNTVAELNKWINKTKAYVDGIYQGRYLANHIVACKDDNYDISDQAWLAIGDEFTEYYGNQTFLNDQNITNAQWNNLNFYVNGDETGWEDGFQFIYHTGHSGTLWSPYSTPNCDNANIPQFLYTEACSSGDFGEGDDSRMELWMSDDGCAFAGIANSAYGWFVASTYYGEEMFDEMFDDRSTLVFCQAHNDAREIYGHTVDSVFGMIVKETNFFGDPAMEYQPYRGEPCQFININGGYNRTTVYDRTPTFNWTKPLNTSWYQLQISTDLAFTDLVVNITNINEINYPSHCTIGNTRVTFTLPNAYALPDSNAIYYCRVRRYSRSDI